MPPVEKIKAVANYDPPRDVYAVQRFLGMFGYFQKFFYNFAGLAHPLYTLIHSEKPKWNKECAESFRALKKCLCSEPILKFADPTLTFVLSTEASKMALGAVLSQRADKENVISYASRKFSPAEQRYHVSEQELLAIVWSVKKFRPFLINRKFFIITDHKALASVAASRQQMIDCIAGL